MNEVLKLSEDGKVLLCADESLIIAIIPEGVEEIGNAAFQNCHELKSVQLPSSLKKIGEGAFAGTGLVSIQIPEGVTEIGYVAFFNSYHIRSIIIPSTVEIMIDPFIAVEPHEAYIHIKDLDRLIYRGDWFKCKYLYVPSGMLEAYKQHPVFGKVEHIIEMNKEAYN